MISEFGRSDEKTSFVMPPSRVFPETGCDEADTLEAVHQHLAESPYPVDKNFGISYVGPAHRIARLAGDLARETVFVEWATDIFPGTFRLEKEAVRMVATLLGDPEAVGFITSGGTESNMLAMRLARNVRHVSDPEIVLPETAHFSFRLAGELFGLRLRELPVNADGVPDTKSLRGAVNRHTVALVCSAPEGNFGLMDPVADFAELAEREGLFLHVDAAFGGFILPFMRDLGHEVPQFDFSLPGVSSMMTDGHKLGLLPVPTSFFLLRDPALLDAIPTQDTLIHTLSSTKPGANAAAAWATFTHLGREGYRAHIRHLLQVRDRVVGAIEKIHGLRLVVDPFISIVTFTSDSHDLRTLYELMRTAGWGMTIHEFHGEEHLRLSIHPQRTLVSATAFGEALAAASREARRTAV